MTHRVVTPKILYFGTPVVLVSTLNEDGSPNLAPMSSAWWLGTSCVLGLSARSKTTHNLRRTGECVLNLPSAEMVDAVDRLALLTGSDPVPEYKQAMGYRHEPRKFAAAGLTAVPADLVGPPRVHECPVQMEAVVRQMHPVGGPDRHLAMIEVSVTRVHADEDILVPGHPSHFDPDRWRPLIMSFCEFYGLGGKVHPSRLAAAYAPNADSAGVQPPGEKPGGVLAGR
ncbi:MAG TPA: flavin reductase family protein [Longimicrobium sp.]|nr:flavin reductase family protein [Longimicrobium sp.]